MRTAIALAPVGEYGVMRAFPSGIQVYGQDESPVDVYIIKTGVIKLAWSDGEGRETIVGLRWPGSFLSASNVVARSRHSASAVTVSASILEQITGSRFMELLCSDSQFSMKVHEAQSLDLIEQTRHIAGLAVESAKQRFSNFVERLTHVLPDEVFLPDGRLNSPLNKKDLAALIAIEPAHLSRLLKELVREGSIRVGKQWIVIQNIDALLGKSTTRFVKPVTLSKLG